MLFKKTTTLVTAILAATMGALVFTGLASADDNSCQPDPAPLSSCVSSAQVSYDHPATSFQVVSGKGKVNGKQEVRFTQPSGATKAQMASVTTCYIASFITRPAQPGHRCGEVAVGTWFKNSGICRATGSFCEFWDQVDKGDEFDLAGVQWHLRRCWNSVWFKNSLTQAPSMHILLPSQVDVVAHFSASITVEATTTSTAHAQSFAAARCELDLADGSKVIAEGMAYGEGTATATGHGRATASTMVQAEAHAKNASLVDLKIHQPEATASASSQSSSSAWSGATAIAKCSAVPPQPTPGGPPPSGPPPSCGNSCSPPPCSGNSCSPPPCSGNSCSPPPCSGNSCSPPPISCYVSASGSKSNDNTVPVSASIVLTSGSTSQYVLSFQDGPTFNSQNGSYTYPEGSSDHYETISGSAGGVPCTAASVFIPAAASNGGPGGPG